MKHELQMLTYIVIICLSIRIRDSIGVGSNTNVNSTVHTINVKYDE